jgi:hypothetical protein
MLVCNKNPFHNATDKNKKGIPPYFSLKKAVINMVALPYERISELYFH